MKRPGLVQLLEELNRYGVGAAIEDAYDDGFNRHRRRSKTPARTVPMPRYRNPRMRPIP